MSSSSLQTATDPPPPSTPPTDARQSTSSSTPASDDSSIFELSFDYQVDAAGNIIRVSKGSSRSNNSSPPTPPNDVKPISPSSAPRRASLSRSESAHQLPLAQQPPQVHAPRMLQRTSSVPASTTPASSSRLAPISTGLRRVVGRPQRVTLDEYREMEEKNRLLDEKENLHRPSVGDEDDKRPSPPPVPASRLLTARAPRALADAPQRHARSAIAGPRAGRILKSSSTKYQQPSTSSSSVGFEKITEVDGTDSEAYASEEPDSAVDEVPPPPTSAPANGTVRQRTYGLTPTIAPPSLSQSGSTRPRRSASLSDAAAPDIRYSPPPQIPSQGSRPGSSLGLNPNRARRVTLEEKMRLEREAAIELEEQTRREAEEADAMVDGYPSIARQSPSPTHLSAQHLRPSYSHHQRRDSDTLRSVAAPEPQNQPQHERLSPPPPRQGSSLAANSAGVGLGARHRRSPTAPEPGTTSAGIGGGTVGVVGKTWAAGDAGEEDRERAMGRSVVAQHQHQQQQSIPPPPVPASAMTAPDVRSKNLFVNKKAYARLDMIGKGGSSRVYRVMNHANVIYAIKRVSLDKTDAETMSGYMNEIALLKRLEGNARIIRLVDSEVKPGPGGSRGHLMLVMECGEIDLARLLQEQQKEPMNMVWISYYWQQMLQAVHVIHEEKIVHSDLKPANFVLVKGQLKLIDFGIANAIANDTTNIQRDHQIGTVNYMSPEAIELPDGMRRLKVGRPSDVWSLGCILYQMVYGHPPFQHLSVYQKMKAIPDLTHVIDFPEWSTRGQGADVQTKLRRSVRKDVVDGMKSCLCRNPKERSTIPELMEQGWLSLKEVEKPAVKELLAPDETIINPYYMSQLLQWGIKLGQAQKGNMDPEDLTREAERLVAELKSLES